jgi:hypothetical protein
MAIHKSYRIKAHPLKKFLKKGKVRFSTILFTGYISTTMNLKGWFNFHINLFAPWKQLFLVLSYRLRSRKGSSFVRMDELIETGLGKTKILHKETTVLEGLARLPANNVEEERERYLHLEIMFWQV